MINEIKVSELSREHSAVRAAYAMVEAHSKYETMLPALEEVADEFPELTNSQLILLWIGINAKNREHLDS